MTVVGCRLFQTLGTGDLTSAGFPYSLFVSSGCIFSAYVTEVTVKKMRRGRILVKGKAEEIAVSPGPSARQKHGKRWNPYSTSGLHKFQAVCDELSSKRQYAANKAGVPEAMVRFVSSKKEWIPVVIGATDQKTWKENPDGDTSRVSILVPAENNNDETGGELRRNDERGDNIGTSKWKGFTVSASTSSVKAHGDPADFCGTVALPAVNPQNNNPEHSQNHHRSEAKRLRKSVSMDNWPRNRPASPVMGSDNFYRKTRPAVAHDANVAALTVTFITLFCFVFYGPFCAILFSGTWLYLVAMFR